MQKLRSHRVGAHAGPLRTEPIVYRTAKQEKRIGQRGSRPEFAGKISAACKRGEHKLQCTKMDCPCTCHKDEKV